MNIHNLYDQRQSYFLTSSPLVRGGLITCIGIGLLTFALGMYYNLETRTWGSFLFNLFWFFSIALGGVAFSAMQDVIGAVWGRPIMRIHESFASFLPVASLLLVIFFLCIGLKVGRANEVYHWIKDPSILEHFWGKKSWLQPSLMMGRDLIALGVILCTALWQLRLKLRRDMALVRGEKEKAMELGLEAKKKLRHYSAPVLILYALAFSILAFDLAMSLAPTWLSTLWAGWSFAVMMQSLMATLLVSMFVLKRTQVGQVIRRQQFHDVGKIMHGFTIFWAYLTYAHVLTYWYGNMPEETEYFLERMHQPWLTLLLVAPICCFIFPLFALIPKASKWTAGLALPICGSILFAQWLVNLLVVMPQVVEGKDWSLPWLEAGQFVGFLGIFLCCIFWFGKRFPMLGIADPLLPEALNEQH